MGFHEDLLVISIHIHLDDVSDSENEAANSVCQSRGEENSVDGVNDSVLTYGVGGIGCSTSVVVKLSDKGFIHIGFSELLRTSKRVATECFEGSHQLVRVKILGDNVGFNN